MLGGVILGFLIAVAIAGATNLFVQEFESRLQRIPGVLVHIAARAQPCADRAELVQEAEAELSFILSETGGLPLTRLWRGLRYAGGLVKASPHLSGEPSSASVWGSALVSGLGITLASFSVFMACDGSWEFSPLGELMQDFSDGPVPGLGRLYWLAGMVNELSTLTLSISLLMMGAAIAFAGRVHFQHWTVWEIMKVPARALGWGWALFAFSGVVGGLSGVEIDMHTSRGIHDPGVKASLVEVAVSVLVVILLGTAHKVIKRHVGESADAPTPA
jgi:hypothetical protein